MATLSNPTCLCKHAVDQFNERTTNLFLDFLRHVVWLSALLFRTFSGYIELNNHGLYLPTRQWCNLRVRVAASCLAIAQDHHHAIVVLLDHALFASSFALLRCEFEAYVRGEWLALCATDEEVEAFSNGDEPPPMRRMLEALENTAAFAEKNSLSNQGEILERNVRVHAHRRATRAAMGNG
jgi:hypothetical protein